MKKLILSTILLTASIFSTSQFNAHAITLSDTEESKYEVVETCEYLSPNYCGNNSLTNGLESNQTTLFYMYSDEVGHYFIDPLSDSENVIYVGLDDYKVLKELEIDVSNLHHGKRFIGTFVDNSLWELIGLEEVFYK